MIEVLTFYGPFALSLSKGLFADVKRLFDRWPLAGVAGSKLLSFASPKESNQRKGDPTYPRNPENRACRVGGKELAPLLLG